MTAQPKARSKGIVSWPEEERRHERLLVSRPQGGNTASLEGERPGYASRPACRHHIRSSLDIERGQLAKHKLLKSGVMTDLLTGRVRVPDRPSSVKSKP